MSAPFDPYYKWLGIPPKDQPPTHYRLLGLDLFESDADVIESAADRAMGHLRSMQIGPHGALSQQLLNEVAAAKRCLLDPVRKAAYDQTFVKGDMNRSLPRALPATLPAYGPPVLDAVALSRPIAPPVAMPVMTAIAVPLKRQPVLSVVEQLDSSAFTSKPIWREPIVVGAATVGIAVGLIAIAWMALVSRQPPGRDNLMAATAPPPIVSPSPQAKVVGESGPTSPLPESSVESAKPRNNSDSQTGAVASQSLPQTADKAEPTIIPHRPQRPNDPVLPAHPTVRRQPGRTAAFPPQANLELPSEQPRLGFSSEGPPIDLLKQVSPERDAVSGHWYFDGTGLVAPENLNWARLQIPMTVPDEYLLTVEITSPARFDNLNLGLVGGGSQFMYCVTAFGKGGLFLLDGKEWHVNETSYPARRIFHPGSNTVTCIVHKKGVLAQVNRHTLLDWEGDFRRLSVQPFWRMPSSETLFLGTGPRYTFTKVELQAIRSLP